MAKRGVQLTYETVREWSGKFGALYATQLIKKRARVGGKWPFHLRRYQGKFYKAAIAHSQLIIHTALGSAGRDPINGFTPDLLYVCRGSKGTIAEMAFAQLSVNPFCL